MLEDVEIIAGIIRRNACLYSYTLSEDCIENAAREIVGAVYAGAVFGD